jgi:hypothetical protein
MRPALEMYMTPVIGPLAATAIFVIERKFLQAAVAAE